MPKPFLPGHRLRLACTLSLLLAGGWGTAAISRGAAPSSDPKESRDKGESAAKAVVEKRQQERRFYMAMGVGTDFDTGATNFVHSAASPVYALPQFIVVGPGVTVARPLSTRARSFSDVYPHDFDHSFYRPQVEFGYVLNRHLELFGNFAYTRADSRTLTAGNSNVFTFGGTAPPPFPDGVFPLRAIFGDYRSYGGELGVRYFFLPPGARLRPYVSLSGGATYVEAIDAQLFTTAPDGVTYQQYRGGFYRSSWVGSATFLLGAELALNSAFSLTLEGGLRYQSGLETDRNVQASLGRVFQGSTGDRLFCPLTLSAKWRF